MAGDRSLAFAMAGMMGATALWVCQARMEPPRAQPANSAYAAPAIRPQARGVYTGAGVPEPRSKGRLASDTARLSRID
jgi:hypothetical protein